MENKPAISPKEIKNLIYTIRDKQVMLDSDLAVLYQVETKNLNKAVKRNIDRFPEKFCFQLTVEEVDFLSISNLEPQTWGEAEDVIFPTFSANKE